MNERLSYIKNNWNKTADSPWYCSLRTAEKIQALAADPASAFHPAVYQLIKRYVPDLSGKQVLLPSSGDNHAAFAFSLMGAQVTSADISEKQLEHAEKISKQLGLNIRFVCDDTMQLSHIADNQFDLVYTSNGTLSWIDDIRLMYQNIARVLQPAGYAIMYDVHPFTRPFACIPWEEPKIIKPYAETMPHCHWRIQDICNAILHGPMHIREMAELPAIDASFWFTFDQLQEKNAEELADINDWHQNPMAALPVWLSIAAQK